MIDKKQLIEELLECVKDATNTETQITGLSMCATLMNEVLDEALTIPVVVGQSKQYHCELYDFGRQKKRCEKQCDSCKWMEEKQ